jgi:hypothetical protein
MSGTNIYNTNLINAQDLAANYKAQLDDEKRRVAHILETNAQLNTQYRNLLNTTVPKTEYDTTKRNADENFAKLEKSKQETLVKLEKSKQETIACTAAKNIVQQEKEKYNEEATLCEEKRARLIATQHAIDLKARSGVKGFIVTQFGSEEMFFRFMLALALIAIVIVLIFIQKLRNFRIQNTMNAPMVQQYR